MSSSHLRMEEGAMSKGIPSRKAALGENGGEGVNAPGTSDFMTCTHPESMVIGGGMGRGTGSGLGLEDKKGSVLVYRDWHCLLLQNKI